MKKCLMVVAFFLLFQVNANATLLDSYINYTGNEVIWANDVPHLMTNVGQGLGLGGPVWNDFIVAKAFQFTVDQPLLVDHLSIDAQQIPYAFHDPIDPQYNDPQKMDVYFKLYSGSIPGQNSTEVIPDPNSSVLTSSTHTFATENEYDVKNYNDFNIPFQTSLEPGNSYWIWAADQQGGQGSTLNYSTKFGGQVVPEPATMFLLGFGLVSGAVMRRKIV